MHSYIWTNYKHFFLDYANVQYVPYSFTHKHHLCLHCHIRAEKQMRTEDRKQWKRKNRFCVWHNSSSPKIALLHPGLQCGCHSDRTKDTINRLPVPNLVWVEKSRREQTREKEIEGDKENGRKGGRERERKNSGKERGLGF